MYKFYRPHYLFRDHVMENCIIHIDTYVHTCIHTLYIYVQYITYMYSVHTYIHTYIVHIRTVHVQCTYIHTYIVHIRTVHYVHVQCTYTFMCVNRCLAMAIT